MNLLTEKEIKLRLAQVKFGLAYFQAEIVFTTSPNKACDSLSNNVMF